MKNLSKFTEIISRVLGPILGDGVKTAGNNTYQQFTPSFVCYLVFYRFG
jgi:hypothetical protein